MVKHHHGGASLRIAGRNILKSKDGTRDSNFYKGLKAVGKFAKDSGIATMAADRLASAAKTAVSRRGVHQEGRRSTSMAAAAVGRKLTSPG